MLYDVARMRQSEQEYRERVGDLIRRAREYKGWSQEDLAKAVGVVRGTILKYELGRTSPTADQMPRILAAVGLKLSALEEPPPKAHWVEADLTPYLLDAAAAGVRQGARRRHRGLDGASRRR